MTGVQITNGMVKYGQTVKTGDFENKRGDVELSFNIGEGQDTDEAYELVINKVHTYLGLVLNGPAGKTADKPKLTRAPKIPTAAKAETAPEETKAVATDASAVEEPEKQPNFIGKKKADAAEVVEEESLDDILGGGVTEVKEVTDKELLDATNKVQAACKNAPAIRKLFTDILAKSNIKVPPGRVIDIPQAHRKEYIDKLAGVKPLA